MALEDMVGSPEADADDEAPIGEGGSLKKRKIRALKRMFKAYESKDWDSVAEEFLAAKELCDEYDEDEDTDEAEADEGYGDDDEEA